VYTRVPRVDRIAREAGLSRRRFTQLFREQIGLTPKLLPSPTLSNRIEATGSGGSVDWAELALTAGYYDQAHLAHEFQDFSGLSPSAYLLTIAAPNNVSID
jgi:AraC-like DNA-binding protein